MWWINFIRILWLPLINNLCSQQIMFDLYFIFIRKDRRNYTPWTCKNLVINEKIGSHKFKWFHIKPQYPVGTDVIALCTDTRWRLILSIAPTLAPDGDWPCLQPRPWLLCPAATGHTAHCDFWLLSAGQCLHPTE